MWRSFYEKLLEVGKESQRSICSSKVFSLGLYDSYYTQFANKSNEWKLQLKGGGVPTNPIMKFESYVKCHETLKYEEIFFSQFSAPLPPPEGSEELL